MLERFVQDAELAIDVEPELRHWIRRDSSSPVVQDAVDADQRSISQESSPPAYADDNEPPPYEEAIKLNNDLLKCTSSSNQENQQD